MHYFCAALLQIVNISTFVSVAQVFLLCHQVRHLYREEPEADGEQRGGDPVHDLLLAHGRLRLCRAHR